jgi:hypothetical protein
MKKGMIIACLMISASVMLHSCIFDNCSGFSVKSKPPEKESDDTVHVRVQPEDMKTDEIMTPNISDTVAIN